MCVCVCGGDTGLPVGGATGAPGGDTIWGETRASHGGTGPPEGKRSTALARGRTTGWATVVAEKGSEARPPENRPRLYRLRFPVPPRT